MICDKPAIDNSAIVNYPSSGAAAGSQASDPRNLFSLQTPIANLALTVPPASGFKFCADTASCEAVLLLLAALAIILISGKKK